VTDAPRRALGDRTAPDFRDVTAEKVGTVVAIVGATAAGKATTRNPRGTALRSYRKNGAQQRRIVVFKKMSRRKGEESMDDISITVHQDHARRFENLLWDYQRSLPRKPGQIGVSMISPPCSGPDVSGNVTYCRVPQLALLLIKESGIPHKVSARAA
jgi:hypothetical protein